MKNRRYIPKEIKPELGKVQFCFRCIHEKKCINGTCIVNDCGSFQQRAGIKK